MRERTPASPQRLPGLRILWPAAFLALSILGALLLDGGYVHYEGQFFLVSYLDTRSFAEKLFSAHFNEWDCYQGRELSFLFGWLDAEFIRYAARAGWVHLYSITHFAGLFALAMILWRALPRMFDGLAANDSGLIVALLLTTPTALFSGYYYRPAKILAAVFFAVVLACIGRIREREWRVTPPLAVAMGIAATWMGMSDRLGIYMLILIVMTLAVSRPFDRSTRLIAAVLILAIVLNVVWSTAIGPHLSAGVDGYTPDTIDQVVHLRFTYLRSEHYAPALSLLADHLKYFFGNFGLLSVIGPLGLAAIITWRVRSRRMAIAAAVVIAASAAVYVAMYARLASLPWPASRRVYYWLPQLVVLAAGAALFTSRSRAVLRNGKRAVTPLLGVMVAGNLFSIPSHREAIRSQEHRPWIVQSPALRSCIEDTTRDVSYYRLDSAYAQVCGALRAAARGAEWDGTPSATPNPRLYCRFSGKSQRK
ncbi:MAG TPA: hypothetical protein VF042_07430 [Gemmatimonadaceae bacterium]